MLIQRNVGYNVLFNLTLLLNVYSSFPYDRSYGLALLYSRQLVSELQVPATSEQHPTSTLDQYHRLR